MIFGWLKRVPRISLVTLSRRSPKALDHVSAMQVFSSGTRSSSSVEIHNRRIPMCWTTHCTFSTQVSIPLTVAFHWLTHSASRQWSRASPPGPRPAGRYGHTLNILGSKIYIFGGQVEGSFYNDLIAFDLNALQNPTNQWEFLIPNTNGQPSQNVPPARTNHTMISHNDSLFL